MQDLSLWRCEKAHKINQSWRQSMLLPYDSLPCREDKSPMGYVQAASLPEHGGKV